MKNYNVTPLTIITVCALVAVLILVAVIGVVSSRKFENDTSYYEGKFQLAVIDKVDPTEDSKKQDGYATAFEILIRNNCPRLILKLEGELVIYNALGEELATHPCSFDCKLDSEEEDTFIININSKNNEKAFELYYADLKDLSATFKLTKVTYKGEKVKEYSVDPVVILETDISSDGTSSSENAYQEALKLFKQKKYSKAMSILNELGDYKDCAEIIAEIATTAETDAEKLANDGDYAGACKILAAIGYTEETNDIYRAYVCAAEGKFPDAVQYGLPVMLIPEGTEAIPDDYLKNTNSSKLKKVILPASIKTIGNGAFYGCNALEEINLPVGLTSIGDYAFEGCAFKEITLPNTLQTIGKRAFANCTFITNVTLPSSITALGESAFYGCVELSSITIPGNIKTISNNAFAYCKNLTKVSVPEGIESIGESAFESCTALTTVFLPTSLKEIGKYAFSNCNALKEITIPRNVINIESKAFNGCYALERIVFEHTDGWLKNSAISPNIEDARENARDGYSGASWQRKEQ